MVKLWFGPADGGLLREIHAVSCSGGAATIVTGIRNIIHASVTNKTGNRAGMAVDFTTTKGTVAITGATTTDALSVDVLGN